MILGIGVDIVHLPRIAAVIKRQSSEKLARRILSSSELQQWIQLRDSDIQQQVRFLGVRCVPFPRYIQSSFIHWFLAGQSKRRRTRLSTPQQNRLGKS